MTAATQDRPKAKAKGSKRSTSATTTRGRGKGKAVSVKKAQAQHHSNGKRKNGTSTPEQRELAAKAQKLCKAAAPVTGTNIAKVQHDLTLKASADVRAIPAATMLKLAKGQKAKTDKDQRDALRSMGARLDSNTFYGKKLAAMIVVAG
jgi:hypothetical protein